MQTHFENFYNPPLLLLLLSLFFSSCSFFEDPSIESTETEYIFPEKSSFSGTFAYIYQNDIYLYSFSDGEPQRLTFSPIEPKERIALSYNKQKIAYLDSLGVPQIISTTGSFIESVPVASAVKDFGWSPDDETLYMLVGNELQYFGPSLPIPPLSPHISTDEIYAVSISPNLDLAYTYKFERREATSFVIIDYRNPAFSDRQIGLDDQFRHLRFSPNGSTVLLSLFSQQPPGSGSPANRLILYGRTGSPNTLGNFRTTYHPVFLGNDSIAFGAGPAGRFTVTGGAFKFSNFYMGPIEGNSDASYLTNNTEESSALYIDWKP